MRLSSAEAADRPADRQSTRCAASGRPSSRAPSRSCCTRRRSRPPAAAQFVSRWARSRGYSARSPAVPGPPLPPESGTPCQLDQSDAPAVSAWSCSRFHQCPDLPRPSAGIGTHLIPLSGPSMRPPRQRTARRPGRQRHPAHTASRRIDGSCSAPFVGAATRALSRSEYGLHPTAGPPAVQTLVI